MECHHDSHTGSTKIVNRNKAQLYASVKPVEREIHHPGESISGKSFEQNAVQVIVPSQARQFATISESMEGNKSFVTGAV